MDPNETMRQIRALCVRVAEGTATAEDARELRGLFRALRTWERMRGFRPGVDGHAARKGDGYQAAISAAEGLSHALARALVNHE